MTLELVLDTKCTLGEGPCWSETENLLYWVDIMEKKYYTYHVETLEVNEVFVDQLIGTIALRQKGGVILALQNGFHFYDVSNGLSKIIDPESGKLHNRFNDGKCDPAGRFWAGTMNLNGEKEQGALYLLDTDLTVDKKLENVSISNGLAWSPDYSFMYFIDTPTKQVVRYNYDNKTGSIGQPKAVISFPEGVGFPDGMTIDHDGMLWIAHWGGYGISKWNPNTGKQIEFISVPAANVTACAFGGVHGNDLYITTARIGTSELDLEKYPNAGGIFKMKTEVGGNYSYLFKG